MCSCLLSQLGGLELDAFLNQVLPLYAGPCLSSGSAAQDASFYWEKIITPPTLEGIGAFQNSLSECLEACGKAAGKEEPSEPFLVKLDLSALTAGALCAS